jgi:hypothetical protein
LSVSDKLLYLISLEDATLKVLNIEFAYLEIYRDANNKAESMNKANGFSLRKEHEKYEFRIA